MANSNSLWISWHDSNWIPVLNPANVMDYFSEKSNPFYDRSCNNEIVKMQKQNMELLNNMTGMEYILLHVQDPILYVIRKQHRHSASEATPLADYHIIAGIVYQAPDLASVFNSRLLSTVHHLQSAFEEASSYARYHPSKGYSWDFSTNKAIAEKTKAQVKKEAPTKEEPSSLFQRQRVDMLLSELLRKFPPPVPQQTPQATANATGEKSDGTTDKSDNKPDAKEASKENLASNQLQIKQEPVDPNSPMDTNMSNIEVKQEVTSEIMKAPPEKKMKI